MNNEKFFHISEIYNRNSILKNGIIPNKILLNHHIDTFKEDNILKENEDKISYFFTDSKFNEKFFKDTVFCKVWIHPRNKIFNIYEENYINYSKYLNRNLYNYNQMIFDIYEVQKLKEPILNYRPFHIQFQDEDKYASLYKMPDEFAHDNKILAFSKNSEKNIKIIGQIEFEFTKNKKYNIKLKNNRV